MGFSPDPAEGNPQAQSTCHISIGSNPTAVRMGLKALFAAPILSNLSQEDRGQTEIVVAEVLNNIVEHAYAQYPGTTEISVRRDTSGLFFSIVDTGLPLPGEVLPKGELPGVDALEDLPEGGFGWHLIRSLATQLKYQRNRNQNCLCFHIATSKTS
jgi:serine/threonine-protein kinase RsbW